MGNGRDGRRKCLALEGGKHDWSDEKNGNRRI